MNADIRFSNLQRLKASIITMLVMQRKICSRLTEKLAEKSKW